LRDELLNETLFRSLPHARATPEAWRGDYNIQRPHSKLGWLTPCAYAAHHPPRALPLRHLESSTAESLSLPYLAVRSRVLYQCTARPPAPTPVRPFAGGRSAPRSGPCGAPAPASFRC
jgi:hypothetical protein